MTEHEMAQLAPYPHLLAGLVELLAYRPGWTFRLDAIDRGQGSAGLTFIVISQGYDTYNVQRGETYRVAHYFPVPPAAYDERSWRRWLLERLLEVERHECCEFFRLATRKPCTLCGGEGSDLDDSSKDCDQCDGRGTVDRFERPYAPHHGPGHDPYIIFERGTDEDARTSFRGEVG